MYTIYRIVNFRNGKVYIGQTRNLRSRKSTHFSKLRAGTHTNIHLQNAFNKYGEGAFFFEVLEKHIPEISIYEREKYWIEYFEAFTKGYNRTRGGEGKPDIGIKCTWNGIEYDSITAAARSVGIDQSTMRARLAKGYTCDADEPGKNRYFRKPFTWNGIEYPSRMAASRATGHHESYFSQRISSGRTNTSPYPRSVPCVWRGIKYPSMAAAAKTEGVNNTTMKRWLNKGYQSREDARNNAKDRWGNPFYPVDKKT